MAKLLDKIVVVDVEATCWEGEPPLQTEMGGSAIPMLKEIIEIGVTTLDTKTLEISTPSSIIVRPQYSTVSKFCTELTTLTQDQVSAGVSFSHACLLLRSQYRTPLRTVASFGDYDRLQFERQRNDQHFWFSGQPPAVPIIYHLNVKNLFALVFNLEKEVGMDKALKILNIPLAGTHHRGDDDSYNIAKILRELLIKGRR